MPSELLTAIVYSALAGAAIPLGASLASFEHIRPRWLELEVRHSVIAFGGGVLIAAVAFVLAPEGIEHLPPVLAVASLIIGGLTFFALDRAVQRHGGSASQLTAMVADFVPEAMAMGTMFASGGRAGVLLALLIGLQNLPEGFNAYRELRQQGERRRTVLVIFLALVPLGPVAAYLGHAFLKTKPELLGMIMLFAAGGILYLTFQDVAPQAQLKRHWAPSLGAVAGFALGLLGHMVIG